MHSKKLKWTHCWELVKHMGYERGRGNIGSEKFKRVGRWGEGGGIEEGGSTKR